ncbi:MAG: hypothetical protein AAF206_15560 [Bacteroidota bacterium]
MKVKALLFSLLFVGFAFTASAQTATPKVSKKQIRQQKRIAQGVKSGDLTRGEVAQLQRQQRSIQRSKKRAKADGVVTKKERVILNARQKRASANIQHKKNNARDRR